MNQQSYKMLCDDLQEIASEVLNDQESACDFSDDSELFGMDADFMSVFEDR